MSNEFSVCQFFTDDVGHEYVRRYVSAEEAVAAFKHYTNNPAATILGIVDRVIITNGGDEIVAEWKHNLGVVWPPEGDA